MRAHMLLAELLPSVELVSLCAPGRKVVVAGAHALSWMDWLHMRCCCCLVALFAALHFYLAAFCCHPQSPTSVGPTANTHVAQGAAGGTGGLLMLQGASVFLCLTCDRIFCLISLDKYVTIADWDMYARGYDLHNHKLAHLSLCCHLAVGSGQALCPRRLMQAGQQCWGRLAARPVQGWRCPLPLLQCHGVWLCGWVSVAKVLGLASHPFIRPIGWQQVQVWHVGV